MAPVPGAHFSFRGGGQCDGALDGGAVTAIAARLEFVDAQTLFDTCELGPDFNLRGTLSIGSSRFELTVDLVRLALTGPFRLTTSGGGLVLGTAQFLPAQSSTAVQQCLGSGLLDASLAATFSTVTALSGLSVTSPPATQPPPGTAPNPAPKAHTRHHRRRRSEAGVRHSRCRRSPCHVRVHRARRR